MHGAGIVGYKDFASVNQCSGLLQSDPSRNRYSLLTNPNSNPLAQINLIRTSEYNDLCSKLQLDRNDAIQIVNCLPQTVEELRAVLTIKGRFVSTEQLNGILEIMKRYL